MALVLGDVPTIAVSRRSFHEEAAARGLDFVHFNGMSGELYYVEMMGGGGALVDYDGDGDLDVYLVQGRMLGDGGVASATFPPPYGLPLSDRIYRNDSALAADGGVVSRFVDVTAAAGVDLAVEYGMGIAAGDYDDDGSVDLYLTNWGPNQLLRNRGDGTFEEVASAAGVEEPRWSVPATFFDYDGDGRLDLFVGNYVHYRLEADKYCANPSGRRQYCGPLAYPPAPDRLFRNRGDGTFADVTRAAGLHRAFGSALGAVAADLNEDGWTDLYVANDLMHNQLWINRGDRTFSDQALAAGAAVSLEGHVEASMGVDAQDVDGDGDLDLVLTHLDGQTHTLYRNDGQALFRDSSIESGLAAPSRDVTGFGTAFVDPDGDGWLDLFVANGAVRALEPLLQTGDPFPLHQRNQFFQNRGGRFAEVVAEGSVPLLASEVSRGTAVGDIDEDGDADLLVTNNAGPVRLLVDHGEERRPWLGVRALTGPGKRDALGAEARLHLRPDPSSEPPTPAPTRLLRRLHGDGSYASAGDPRALFRFPTAHSPVSLELRWPGGARTLMTYPPVGAHLVLFEPGRER